MVELCISDERVSVRRCGARVAVAIAGCCSAFLHPARAGDVENGLQLARQHCARCHVVGDSNKFGGIGSTPSFRLLVTAFEDWRTRFETFYARRPHPAFVSIEGRGRLREDLPPNAHPVTLPSTAIDDLVALAQDIKAKGARGADKAGQ